MSVKMEHILTTAATVLGSVAMVASSALAGGPLEPPPVSVAEPMSIAAFVGGLAALYAVKKRRKSK